MMCEICGRPMGYEWGQCPHRMDGTSSRCYQLGWEREKSRADALALDVQREKARADALARQVERIVVLAAELHDKKWVVLNHHKNGMAAAAAWVDTCRDSTP